MFHMLTIRHVLACFSCSDWFTPIDQNDAHIYVLIIPIHRKFQNFSFRGVWVQYKRLPFGYTLALCRFFKCMPIGSEAFSQMENQSSVLNGQPDCVVTQPY